MAIENQTLDEYLGLAAASTSANGHTPTTINNYANLNNSLTNTDGIVDSNANKIWNDASSAELQMKLGDVVGNNAITRDASGNKFAMQDGELLPYVGDTRRLYMYGTKGEGDDVKVGLSSSKNKSSDARYMPGLGWPSGEKGVDISKKILDVELPYDKATELEAVIHGNKTAQQSRLVKLEDAKNRKLFGSGASEYYDNMQGIFGDVSKVDTAGLQVPKFELDAEARKSLLPRVPTRGIDALGGVDTAGNSILAEYVIPKADRTDYSTAGRAGNMLKGFVAGAAGGVYDLGDIAAEIVGKDLGTDEEKTKQIDKVTGYDRSFTTKAADKIKNEISRMNTEGIDAKGVLKVLTTGASTFEFLPESLGYLVPMLVGGPTSAAAKGVANASRGLKAAQLAGDTAGVARASEALDAAKSAYAGTTKALDFVSKNAGLLGVSAGTTNDDMDEFAKNAGISKSEVDPTKVAGAFLGNVVLNSIDKWTDLGILKNPSMMEGLTSVVKGMTAKQLDTLGRGLAKTANTVVLGGTKEGSTEYIQTFIEQINKQVGEQTGKTVTDAWNDENNKLERATAGVLGVTGAQQMNIASMPMAALTSTGNFTKEQLAKELNRRNEVKASKQTVTEEPTVQEASSVDKAHMVNVLEALDDDKFDYAVNTKGTLEDINRAEDTLSRITKTKDNAEIITDAQSRLTSAKTRALKLVDSAGAEDFKLGSREDAEALIEFTLENSSKEEIASRDAKMLEIATQFGLEKEYKHLKDYYSVEKEAVEGERGYKGYEKKLKVMLASDAPDTKEITKVVKRLQNFYTQENSYVSALTAGIKEAEAVADAHNKNATLGKPTQYEVTIPGQKTNKPWKINFDEVNGQYVVQPVTYNMLETKKRNVEGIVRALAEGGAKAKAKKIEVSTGTSTGIEVPMVTQGKAKDIETLNKYREMDAGRYNKVGATKVILGLKHDKKWDTYRKLNESKINQGVYASDDVVILNTSELKTTGNKVAFDASTAKEVKAAMKAGATIVIDRGIYGSGNKKDKGAGKLHKQLTLLLSRYSSKDNKYGIVAKADGNTKGSHVFKPKELADSENVKATEGRKVEKEQQATKQKTLDALVLAIANGEDTKELVSQAAEYFRVSKDGTSAKQNALAYASSILEKEIEAGADVWFDDVKEVYGANATDEEIDDILANKEGGIKLENAIGGHKAITSATIKAKVIERVKELFSAKKDAMQLMANWKTLVEAQRVGDKTAKDLSKWLTSKGYTPREAYELSESVAKGLEAINVKLDANGKQVAIKRSKQALKDGELAQTLELDMTKLMRVTKTTLLNTIDLDTILETAPQLKEEVESAIKSIEKAINLDKLRDNSKAKDADKDKMTNREYVLKDAPGLALLLTTDGEINQQTVAALVVALYSGYQNDGYMLNGKPKSADDAANMLGVRASELPKSAAKLVGEKGMLTKSFATDLRKDIANLLGISRISEEGEARRFDQAMTDLAQVAIMIGVDQGTLVLDNKMTTADYAEKVLGLDKNDISVDKGATVSFIRLKTPDALEDLDTNYEELVEDLPMEDSYRKDVRFSKPSDAEIENVLKGIKNDLSGGKIPETAKKLLKKGMKAEHIVNREMLKDILKPEYVDLIKARMGWIAISTHKNPNPTYEALSKDKKDIQEAINRDVEKEIAELSRIADMTTDGEMSLYFMMYYTKNGRYMYDSNTLNPQTNKQLTRWLVQPKDHQNEISYVDGKFMVDGKDATDAYMFALGQALGYAVDKKNFKNTKAVVGDIVATLMNKDNKQLDTLFKDMLENKSVAIGNNKVEIEHIAHAHQAIEMLKGLKAGGKATSSLTAEIDAKTSGFGIKTALMPIIDNVREYLAKVGIVIGSKDKKPVTINELLDSTEGEKNMLDVYQGLGAGMQQIPLTKVASDLKSVMGNVVINDKRKFDGLVNVLPTREEGKDIPSDIRNLFKQPFMEFNYSAGLRSIRRSLALELAHKAAEQGMKSEEDFKKLGLDRITGMRYEEFLDTMLTTNLDDIKLQTFGYKDLEAVLATAMDLMYGTQIEAAFQKEFEPAIKAQGVINQAYQAMFKMFAEVYKVRLAELRAANDGVVTVEQYKKLMGDLRKMFPTIKGPLSEGYDDSVAIYSTKTGTARDAESGAPASQVHINKTWASKNGLEASFGTGSSTNTLQYEIKKFEEAISAGSVIPIHYFDGALMAMTAEEITSDLTMIHDAIMPKVTELFATAKSYNKSMYEKTLGGSRYRIIDELLASLTSVKKEVEAELGAKAFDKKEVKVIKRTLDDDITKAAEPSTMSLVEYLAMAEEQVKTLAESVDTAIKSLNGDIAKYGASVSHLVAGSNEGTYVVGNQAALNVEVRGKEKPLNARYGRLIEDVVQSINKVSVKKDSGLILKHIAQGIDSYVGGQYDPTKNTIKVAIVPTMEQAFAAAGELVDSSYYKFVEDKQIADEDLYTYMSNDPAYAEAKARVPELADELLKKVAEIIKTSGLHTVTHEFVHAGAVNFMKNNPEHAASKRIQDVFAKVQHPRHKYKLAEAGVDYDYWKTNVDEFLAEALSNPKLMVALSNIKLTYGDKLASALEWVVDAAMKMLGFKQNGSAYEFVLDGFAALIEAQKEVNEVESNDPTKTKSKLKQVVIKENSGKIQQEKASIFADLQALLGNAGKKELKELADMMKDC